MSEEAMQIPYGHLLGERDAAVQMRQTLPEFESLLRGFSSERIDAQPAPGKWSLREVLCHMADCEVAWGWRLRQAYAEHNPALQGFEQDAWARAYGGAGYTADAALSSWRASRGWNLAFIDGLSEQDKARPAVHSSAGPITLWTLVKIAAGHDLHHLAALRKLAAR